MRTELPKSGFVRTRCAHCPWLNLRIWRKFGDATQLLQKESFTMQSMLRGAIAFAELLSCGFATIGVRETLVAVAAQLADDALGTLIRRRRPATVEA